MAEAVDDDDDDELAQWMPECDECDNPAEHVCKTCGDKLCSGCKSRKRHRNHQVVPYSDGVKLLHKSKSSCPRHPGEKYQVFCKPCNIPVCTPCIIENHGTKNHELISIADAFSTAKEKATSILSKMMTEIRPSLKETSEKAKKVADNVEKRADRAEEDMRSSIQRLQRELDKLLDENLTKLKQMKEESLAPVKRDLQNIEDVQSRLEASIREYEGNLRSDDPIDLITFMTNRQTDDPDAILPVPATQDVAMVDFLTPNISREILISQFGSLISKKDQEREKDKVEIGEHESKSDGEKHETNKSIDTNSFPRDNLQSPVRHVMSKAVLRSEFSIAHTWSGGLYSLRCQGSDRVWIAGSDDKIYLVDRTGNIIHVINAGCGIYYYTGLCVTDEHELVYSDYGGMKLKKISQDYSMTTLFSTGNNNPQGLHQHRNGHLMVCLSAENVVRVYDRAGKMSKDIGKGHLYNPQYVTVNKVNDDVCVSDSDSQIVVFTSSGDKRFTYTGDGTRFDPHELCCDQLGNILITDCGYCRVHIIDRDGHFLQYLVSGRESITSPITIDIDNSGYAVVGECISRKVKKFTYLE